MREDEEYSWESASGVHISYDVDNDEIIMRDDESSCMRTEFTTKQMRLLFVFFLLTDIPDLTILGFSVDNQINFYIHLLIFVFITIRILCLSVYLLLLRKSSDSSVKRRKLSFIVILSSVLNIISLSVSAGIDKKYKHHDMVLGISISIFICFSSVLFLRALKTHMTDRGEFMPLFRRDCVQQAETEVSAYSTERYVLPGPH